MIEGHSHQDIAERSGMKDGENQLAATGSSVGLEQFNQRVTESEEADKKQISSIAPPSDASEVRETYAQLHTTPTNDLEKSLADRSDAS